MWKVYTHLGDIVNVPIVDSEGESTFRQHRDTPWYTVEDKDRKLGYPGPSDNCRHYKDIEDAVSDCAFLIKGDYPETVEHITEVPF